MKPAEIGQAVVYVDEHGHERAAIVTSTFNDGKGVNVVMVSNNVAETDTYGRQIERRTSVAHQSAQHAPGNFWKHVGEVVAE